MDVDFGIGEESNEETLRAVSKGRIHRVWSQMTSTVLGFQTFSGRPDKRVIWERKWLSILVNSMMAYCSDKM